MADSNTTSEDAAAERVPVEQPTGAGADVAKAMEHVAEIVNSITKSKEGDAVKATPEAASEETETEKAGKAGKFPKGLFKQMLKKAGVEEDAMKSILDGLQQQFDAGAAVTKSTEVAEEVAEETEAPGTPITFENFGEMVQKAAMFTPERVTKLNEAFETLKLVIEAIGTGQFPKNKVPTTTSFGASGVKDLTSPSAKPVIKSENGGDLAEVLKGLNTITDTLKAHDEKFKALEEARPASTSLDDGHGDGKTTTTQKSIWGGVL